MDQQNDHALKQAALLEHQAKINAAKVKIQGLQSTLFQHESKLATLIGQIPDLNQLNQEWEDILAEAASGETDEAKRKSVAEKLEAAQSNSQALKPEIERSRQTIAGLQRKIGDAENILNGLRDDLPRLLRAFLLTESNAVAIKYQESARALLREHHRLEGLSLLLSDLGHVPSLSRAGNLLVLPAYETPAFDGNRSMHSARNLVFNGPLDWNGRARINCAILEADRVRALGVDCERFVGPAK